MTVTADRNAVPLGTPDALRETHAGLALSVILVTPDHYEAIRETIRHLRAQTVADRLEVVIVAPSQADLHPDEADLSVFGAWKVVEVGPIRTLAAAKVAAVQQISVPFIVTGEDHSYPEPGWAEALIAAHAKGHAVVGPVVRNGNPRSMLSWANYIMNFGSWMPETARSGEVGQTPWHNSSYRRDILLAFGERMGPLLSSEGMLHQEIQSQGHTLYLAADTATSHLNISRWGRGLGASFWGGRLFGATRARDGRWPAGKRFVYAGGSPLVPLMRLSRLRKTIEGAGLRHLTPAIYVTMFPLLIAHAAGEAVGYLLGAGPAEERYSFYEMRRVNHLCPPDREEFGGKM